MVITLGRYGDCLNSLGIAWYHYNNGNKVTFVIGREWASLLEGVSYCDPLVYDGPYKNCMAAKHHVESLNKFDTILVPQCYGQAFKTQCNSFCEEAWRLAGVRNLWGKLPLIIDRRDREREAKLIPDFKKPMVLVATQGLSSAFHKSDELWDVLKPLRDQYELVDLSQVHGDRFFDLLGLYEKAEWLVAIDSGPLHLAEAVPTLKVVALIADKPTIWYGSPPRKNHLLRIRYGDFDKGKNDIVNTIKTGVIREGKCIHVWSDYPRQNKDAIRRHEVAKQTWKTEFGNNGWVEMAVPEAGFMRNARLNYGEMKAAPFFGDLIDRAAEKAQPGDIIAFTNDDTCVVQGAANLIRSEVLKCGAVFCSRIEHTYLSAPLPREAAIKGGTHVGADIFAFTVDWWKRWRRDMPDMLIAFEAFDLVLRKLITMHGGKELMNCCYHENHIGDWTKNRLGRGSTHNRQTAGQWLKAHGVPWGEEFGKNIKPRAWPIP